MRVCDSLFCARAGCPNYRIIFVSAIIAGVDIVVIVVTVVSNCFVIVVIIPYYYASFWVVI